MNPFSTPCRNSKPMPITSRRTTMIETKITYQKVTVVHRHEVHQAAGSAGRVGPVGRHRDQGKQQAATAHPDPGYSSSSSIADWVQSTVDANPSLQRRMHATTPYDRTPAGFNGQSMRHVNTDSWTQQTRQRPEFAVPAAPTTQRISNLQPHSYQQSGPIKTAASAGKPVTGQIRKYRCRNCRHENTIQV